MIMGGDAIALPVNRFLDQRTVLVRAMEALVIVLHRVLPVGLERVLAAIGALQFRRHRREGRDLGFERCRHLAEGRCVAIKIDEEETQHLAHGDLLEVIRRGIEASHAFTAPRRTQGAALIIRPVVIGAGDDRTKTTLSLKQAVGAMLADVEKGLDLALRVAQHDHALIDDVAHDVTAVVRHHRDMPDILPGGMEDPAFLTLVDRRIVVVGCRHRLGSFRIILEAGDRKRSNHGHDVSREGGVRSWRYTSTVSLFNLQTLPVDSSPPCMTLQESNAF